MWICHADVDLFGVEQALAKKEIKMKTLRMLALTIITVLVMSAWAPTYAYAMSDGVTQPAKSQMARLTVNNRTGGTLYVKLSGSANYWFSATSQGKTVFNNIQPGKYTVTLSTSACSGSLKYKVKMNKGGNASLRPVVCRN